MRREDARQSLRCESLVSIGPRVRLITRYDRPHIKRFRWWHFGEMDSLELGNLTGGLSVDPYMPPQHEHRGEHERKVSKN